MDKFFDLIKHFSRDFFIYFLGGGVVLADVIYLNDFFKVGIFNSENIKNNLFILILISYVIGQFITAILEIILVDILKVDNWIIKRFSLKEPDTLKVKEIEIFLKNRDLYTYFIERYSDIYLMRWNLAGSMLIVFILNIALFFINWVFSLHSPNNNLLLYTSLIAFILSVSMFKLHYTTGNHYYSRIEKGFEAVSKSELEHNAIK